MKLKLSLLLIVITFTYNIFAQDDHDHDHENHHYHKKNEIGIAASPVYFVNEKETSFGLHLHYVHNIGESKFGVGLAYEKIFDEHNHNSIGLVGSYRPIHQFSINISPAIAFEGEISSELKFALHLEFSYEFEIKNLHIGPLLQFAYDPEDYHIGLGLHLGFAF